MMTSQYREMWNVEVNSGHDKPDEAVHSKESAPPLLIPGIIDSFGPRSGIGHGHIHAFNENPSHRFPYLPPGSPPQQYQPHEDTSDSNPTGDSFGESFIVRMQHRELPSLAFPDLPWSTPMRNTSSSHFPSFREDTARQEVTALPPKFLGPPLQSQETDSFDDLQFTGHHKSVESENSVIGKVPDSPDLSDNGVDQSDCGWTNRITTSALEGDLSSELSIRFPFSPNEGLLKLLLEAATQIYHELDKLEDSGFALGLDILPHQMDLFDEDDRTHFTGIHLQISPLLTFIRCTRSALDTISSDTAGGLSVRMECCFEDYRICFTVPGYIIRLGEFWHRVDALRSWLYKF
jgi:hypothetical protein